MENEVNGEVVENVNDTTDYKALYEESKASADANATKVSELEWLIQKHKEKKATKASPSSETQTFWKEDMEKMLMERDFYSTNPEMTEHKDMINKFTSNGEISLEQAKMLVLANDPTIQARQNTSNSNFTDWMSWGGTKSYTQEQLQKMPHSEKMQALKDIQAGKATETL